MLCLHLESWVQHFFVSQEENMEWDIWMTFTVWVDLVTESVISVTVYNVLCKDIDLKWIFYKCYKIGLAWTDTEVCQCLSEKSLYIHLYSVLDSFCLCCVTPPTFLCLCLSVWAACKGAYMYKSASRRDRMFDRLSCFLGVLLWLRVWPRFVWSESCSQYTHQARDTQLTVPGAD